MTSKNKEYLDEYNYNDIDELCQSSSKYKELSDNLKDKLSELMESIEDEECKEILSDIEELNKYLIKINDICENKLPLLKNNSKILIEKYIKHKNKILSLKTKNNALEEELSNINEQKEKALVKIDELNDENYKLYHEKINLEFKLSEKTNIEKENFKINKELEINELNSKIEYLNNQLNSYEKKINDLSSKNKEIFENYCKIKNELEYKDKSLEMWISKNSKLIQENKDIKFLNMGLQKTIEEFENQFRDNDKIVKELREKIDYYEEMNMERQLNHNYLYEDENKLSQYEDIDLEEENIFGTNKKRRNGVDYADTGNEINLNDLINDKSESSEIITFEKKGFDKSDTKNKIGLKSPSYKHKRSPSKHSFHKSIDYIKSKKKASNILIKLQSNKDSNDQIILDKNDEKFLSELLFRFLDF